MSDLSNRVHRFGGTSDIETLFLGVSVVRIVIANDMQRASVRIIEHLDDLAVLRIWIGEIAKLNDGIRLTRRHFFHECFRTSDSIVHDVVMQVGYHTNPNGLL